MKKTLKIIAAFAIGAAAGSVLGLLLAPPKEKPGVADDADEPACAGRKKNARRDGGQLINDDAYAKAEADEMM